MAFCITMEEKLFFQYVMATQWDRHWDDLSYWNSSTLFTLPLIYDGLEEGPWADEVDTLFIKLTKGKSFEKSWVGKAKNFRTDSNKGKPAIRFDVSDLKEVDCPGEFKNCPLGWRLNNPADNCNHLMPGFFSEMATCDWTAFENSCFHLLRLLGIHEIHQFLQDDNRGKADGFFKIGTLSVLFDATLEADFDRLKETQLSNYVNQLKVDKFNIKEHSYTLNEGNKEVWIITRKDNARTLRIEDHIKIREIPYTKLIAIYLRRLTSEIGVDELTNLLKGL